MGRLDSWRGIESALKDLPPSVEWSRITPFVIVHLPCLAVFWVRMELAGGSGGDSALLDQDVWHHRLLSPLFFPPQF